MTRTLYLALASALLASTLGACVDPLVGGRCAPGYAPRPGVGCVRVDGGAADGAHDDTVTPPRDGLTGDGASDVAALDAIDDFPRGDGSNGQPDGPADDEPRGDGGNGQGDGSAGDGAMGDAVASDAGPGDGATGDGATGDAGCASGLTACGGVCVDLDSDPRNCGACGHTCAARESCARGVCVARCPAPLVECGGACVDVQTDPFNCGGCGIVCSSGLCNAGVCRDARAGHLVLIGHSYEETRADQDRVLANAVFLAAGSPARVLVYDEFADTAPAGAVARANAAIGSVARPWTATRLTDRTRVSSTLSIDRFDVMLVYEQSRASEAVIDAMATDFGDALASFARAGGVVVVLDGATRGAATHRVMNATGLMNVTGAASADLMTTTLVAPIDALGVGVRASYRAERASATFTTTESYTVFAAGTRPVVMHRGVLR